MTYDIILAGVGGQGVLSVAAVIAKAAMDSGLEVRQSEVHGMAQRGGAVQAHMRISDHDIPSDLIGRGRADMILSMEPMECLRYLSFLKKDGVLVTAAEPFRNIPNYPDEAMILAKVAQVANHLIVPTKELAKKAGSIRATNMVLVGAAGKHLPLKASAVDEAMASLFCSKGSDVVEANRRAIALGAKL